MTSLPHIALSRLDRMLETWLWQPWLKFNAVATFAIGAFFYMDAVTTDSAFSVEVWGEFALRFPAEMWAAGLMAGGALSLIGLLNPPKRIHLLIGSALCLVQFLVLSYSAAHTGGDPVVSLYAGWKEAPMAVLTFVAAARHAVR